jgi:hypothetical protein
LALTVRSASNTAKFNLIKATGARILGRRPVMPDVHWPWDDPRIPIGNYQPILLFACEGLGLDVKVTGTNHQHALPT